MQDFFHFQFGTIDFWDNHGIFFLIFITLFPRLTLFFSSVPFGGVFWWLGFFFAPRLLIAILATLSYATTNPILVIISWIVALSGESGEKFYLRKRIKIVNISRPRWPNTPAQNANQKLNRDEAIDADYRRLD